MPDARKDRLQAVVVDLRHGIEFVVVTAGTMQSQSEERAASVRDHVVQLVLPGLRNRLLILARLTGQQRRGGHEKPRCRIDTRRVAGQLFLDELRIGCVRIERFDDVIAVGPGIVARRVDLETVRLAERNHVQPMSSPSLTVPWRRQHPVHELLKRKRIRVGLERLDLLRRGNDSMQHQ